MANKFFSLAIGFSVLGSSWLAPVRAHAQDAPELPTLPTSPASKAPAVHYTVLLLRNGRVLKGQITEDASAEQYVLTQRGGTIRFPIREAERAFASMEDLYKFKVARLPAGDADETFKLAKWCLEQGLEVHGHEQLEAVLKLSPGFVPAQRMLANLDANASTVVKRSSEADRDPGVALAGGEMPPDRGNAAPFDPRVARARREMMRSGGVPVIFDLPTPIAVKRATEFSKSVHFVIQQNCATCHNEKYNGEFQLIQVRNRRELTPDVLRANLDSVLPLINRENPDRSELLAAALLPHGPQHRQILRGPNDPAYQVLANWVNNLRVATASSERVVSGPSGDGQDEQFGRDRSKTGAPAPLQPTGRVPSFLPTPDAATSLYTGGGMLTPEQLTKMGSVPGAKINATNSSVNANAPGMPANTQFPAPGLGGLPALPAAGSGNPSNASAATSKSKPKKVDPALLEKLLKARQNQP